MGIVGSLWHWCIDHWKSWGITGIAVGIGGGITWLLGTRKQLKETWGAKSEKAIDSRVMKALEDTALWPGPRPMTGGGDVAVRADELARALSFKDETIFDSLERLEARGRVVNIGGSLADSTSRWHTTRRF
jgi:hypothetical protein